MEWQSVFHRRINELWERAKDDNYKLTLEDYAERVGTTRSSLRGWLAGKGQPDAQGFVRIAETEDVSLAWLMGDTRKIGSLTPDEVMLLQKIRGLTDVHKEDIRAFVEHYYAQDNKTKEERPFRAEKRATY